MGGEHPDPQTKTPAILEGTALMASSYPNRKPSGPGRHQTFEMPRRLPANDPRPIKNVPKRFRGLKGIARALPWLSAAVLSYEIYEYLTYPRQRPYNMKGWTKSFDCGKGKNHLGDLGGPNVGAGPYTCYSPQLSASNPASNEGQMISSLYFPASIRYRWFQMYGYTYVPTPNGKRWNYQEPTEKQE